MKEVLLKARVLPVSNLFWIFRRIGYRGRAMTFVVQWRQGLRAESRNNENGRRAVTHGPDAQILYRKSH